jgi:hypothetical protein
MHTQEEDLGENGGFWKSQSLKGLVDKDGWRK